MRQFILALFVSLAFIVNVPSTHAATCPTGTQPNIEDGKYYYQSVECTPGTQPANTNPGVNRPANTNPSSNVTLINPLKSGTTVSSFLGSILDFVITIGSVVVILMLVLVGFKFVVAQGSDSKISEARQMLLWTVIGALVLLGSKVISELIQSTVKALGG